MPKALLQMTIIVKNIHNNDQKPAAYSLASTNQAKPASLQRGELCVFHAVGGGYGVCTVGVDGSEVV